MVGPYPSLNSVLFCLHMTSFLEGPKAAMLASKDFDDGHYKSTPQHGIRAFARVYSAWAYGQTVSCLTMKYYDNITSIVVPGIQIPDGRRVSHV
jgi:hypothetical protein